MDNIFQFDRRILQQFNFILILQLTPLFILSSYLVYEIQPRLFNKQMVYYAIAFGVFFVVFIIPWRRFQWLIPITYWFNLLLLLSVEFFGKTILGARRWIEIPFTGLTLQPSEFIKITVLLMLGYIIVRNPPPKEGYGFRMFIKLSLYILIPFVLIAKEPDLGTGLVLLLTGFGVLFIIGIETKIWLALLLLVGLTAPLLYTYGLKPYQKQRIANFLGKPAKTTIYPYMVEGNKSKIKVIIENGRTHQIRVHLQAVGIPIIGDLKYGKASNQVQRVMLHSKVTRILGYEFQAKEPKEFYHFGFNN